MALQIIRRFTVKGTNPMDAVEWGTRDVVMYNWRDGSVSFEQREVEFPTSWSDTAVSIVASKYFRGTLGTPEREHSLRQVIHRVVSKYTLEGLRHGYFDVSDGSADAFKDELIWMLVHQMFSFNSPVWFNVGTDRKQIVSACYLLSVDDSMESILDWYKEEGLIFKGGSGAGVNLSKIRGSREPLAGGGVASGPISFMRGADSSAGAIKSGGACLAPWTSVYTAERGAVSVKELAETGSDFTVLSYDPTLGRVRASVARAFASGRKSLVSLVTDKGTFSVTPDHRIRLITGEYVEAQQLSAGMSILPVTVDHSSTGYIRVGLRDGNGGKKVLHRMVAQDVMGASLESDTHVHHARTTLDGSHDKYRNGPLDLEILPQGEHYRVHSRELLDQGTHPFQEYFGKEREDIRGSGNGMHRDSEFWKDEDRVTQYKTTWKASMQASDVFRTGQRAAARTRMLNMAYRVANAGYPISTFDEYWIGRLNAVGKARYSKAEQLRKIESRWGSYAAFLAEVRANNHAVVSVTTLSGTYDVYDVEVDSHTVDDGSPADGHNFVIWGEGSSSGYVGSGIVVHNSRRAAKLVCLDTDHPDIEEFIALKAREEKKIRALQEAGFDMGFGAPDAASVQYQNANNSVRVTDEFMEAVEKDAPWSLINRTDGSVAKTLPARELWRQIAQAAWECADPGVQFDTTIQSWHTTPGDGRITTSNPCFTADTMVAVADGRNAVPISELVGSEVDVYSKNYKGNTVISKMSNIRVTQKDVPVVKVTFDDGTHVTCTPDHRFLLRDGTFKEARYLTPSDSLMRFDSEAVPYGGSKSGSLRRRVTGTRGWNWQHHLISERAFGHYRDGNGGVHLDHVNGDSLDDRPDNMRVISAKEHMRHTAESNMLGDQNPARRLMNQAWRDNLSKAMRGSGNPRFIQISDDDLFAVYRTAVLSDSRYGSVRSNYLWNQYIRNTGLKGKVPISSNGRIRGMSWDEFSTLMESRVVNHRAVSVDAQGTQDVYDGEVEDTHNFAVISTPVTDPRTDTMSGVFVHNCSEVMTNDNSSCNLASLNLMKFLSTTGKFRVDDFTYAVSLVIIAMDISISFAEIPVPKIQDNTQKFRQLGIGYSNLGAAIMAQGLAYDSTAGRAFAAAVTSLMSATAWQISAKLARELSAYPAFEKNRTAHMAVVERHRSLGVSLAKTRGAGAIAATAAEVWTTAVQDGSKYGFRNSQISALAPTGTIGLMMDCDTTGVEPAYALVSYKRMADGSSAVLVNGTVDRALYSLGYGSDLREEIKNKIREGAAVQDVIPTVNRAHYPVFSCAAGPDPISPEGHLMMMAAVQPFISGAISKTVNIPEEITPDQIADLYLQAWKFQLKAVALYRDNCKVGQPLSAVKTEEPVQDVPAPEGARRKLPRRRESTTTSFSIGGSDGYMTTSAFPDGSLGELFLKMSKAGSTMAGLLDALAIVTSIGLQHGVPLETLVDKFTGSRFAPQGVTDDPEIRMVTSLLDYVFRRLAQDYLEDDSSDEVLETPGQVSSALTGEMCSCGGSLQRSGSCHVCTSCGTTTGCS